MGASSFLHSRTLVSPTLNFLAASLFHFSFAKSTTSNLNIAVYDFLRTILFSPWVIFLGKFLNYKNLRLIEHTHLKMEAVSISTESHNGVMLPKMEAIT
jgi:hypothetical protein